MATGLALTHADSSLNQLSLEYSYAELQQASRNFDASHRLGHGSFGGVFKGIQRDGTEVAVKVLDVPEEGGFEEEVRVLSKFRHPNLVILMGFARHETQRFLVYELLGGGDVFKRLQRNCVENVPWLWRARVSAAFDAACGLSHLHHATPKVFHRDIKSPNILLDRNGTAKMADFGLACLSHASEHKVQQASGTVGYACPLYVQRGVVTEGSEVYSFGIVLLELLTASPPAYLAQAADGSQQYQFLAVHIGGDARVAVSMADAKAQWQQQVSCNLADLALRCIQGAEELRPDFAEIVNTLRSLRDAPDASLPPALGHAAALGGNLAANWLPQPQLQAPQLQAPQLGAPGALNAAAPAPVPAAAAAQGFQGGAVLGGVVAPGGPLVAAGQSQPQQGPLLPLGGQQRQAQQAPVVLPQPGLVLGASPVARGAIRQAQPTLWTLECVHSEGLALAGLPKERRSLVHRQEPGGPLLATLRVGRLFQEDLFNALVPDEDARSAVSREHFQIWADDMAPLDATPGVAFRGVPCSFSLMNFGLNGTVVNGRLLQQREQTPLHSGDTIALARWVASADGPSTRCWAPFLEFRFDLTGSVLADADPGQEERTPQVAAASAAAPPPRRTNSEPLATAAALSPAASRPAAAPAPAAARQACAEALHEFSGIPFFALEVGGTAVREGALAGQRRIQHGPPAAQEPCPPLLLGRNMQPGFWQRLLIDEAFNALSRQHLLIEVCEEGCSGGPTIFHVRNLSERNPIRVSSSLEDCALESAAPLQRDQRKMLNHGDVIVVNPNKGSTLWLIFRNLTAGRSRQPLAALAALPVREA